MSGIHVFVPEKKLTDEEIVRSALQRQVAELRKENERLNTACLTQHEHMVGLEKNHQEELAAVQINIQNLRSENSSLKETIKGYEVTTEFFKAENTSLKVAVELRQFHNDLYKDVNKRLRANESAKERLIQEVRRLLRHSSCQNNPKADAVRTSLAALEEK